MISAFSTASSLLLTAIILTLLNLLPYKKDKALQMRFYKMKQARKAALANKIFESQGISLDVVPLP